ncbi:heat shock 70 kDa protein 12A-like [Mercenaria mercenaria]|uniref:heat shock 70 kDa protein 12A-like n=1 Tax=Mercenaria mercenaria TaxID=6596 RepID=UPI00234E956B|nr:heat shock 70 kDa protein 12A-like [Mercenaria mercenaria]
MAQSKLSSHLLVAAFDFGTTYSGYSFSFRDDPLKVQTNQGWNAGSEKLISLKTPTCVLLNDKKEFHSFGFEAENKYASLAEDNKHRGWLFFRRFKMLLHNNESLSRATTIEDINGTKMPAMTIFSMSIRYLKDHFLEQLNKQTTGVEETDIQYVITVPAIWDDIAKQFMREAAEQADIDKDRLKLALEPEAASIWCQLVTTEAKGALSGSGTKYMVVDLGGGTADISVHEKNKDGTLKELHKSSGGPWGGMYVDNNYMTWLEKLFGKTALEKLKKEEMAEYFDLLREFEIKKRSVTSKTEDHIIFRISAILKEICEEEEHTSLMDKMASLQLGNKISIRRDKMKIDPAIVRSWFDEPIDNVTKHVNMLLSEPGMKGVSSIILVGGFGESTYVQEKIKKAVSSKTIIVPEEAGLVVLKGAVRFGHEPDAVSARVMNFTYGIAKTVSFDDTKYSASLMEIIGGKKKVDNIFDIFVKIGDTLKHGHEVKRNYLPGSLDETCIRIYRSTDSNPEFTTESSCKKVGQLEIEHKEGNKLKDKEFDAILIFGETELIVKARILKSGKEFYTRINCLK